MSGSKLKILLTVVLMMAVLLYPAQTFAASKTIVSAKDKKYSYKDMQTDLKAFTKKYPEIVSLKIFGKTADKRNIYCLRMGNPNARKQILVQAGIHGREWLNCQVLMKMLEQYLADYETGRYKKKTYAELFNEVAVYAIPMVNPDGVTISQYGPSKIRNKKLRKNIKKMERQGGYSRWKANARGVDLNRNFPADWEKKSKTKKPSSEDYPGKRAKSERETKAVLKQINRLPNLKACVNWHSRGELIYWGAKGKGKTWRAARKLAQMVKGATGYKLIESTPPYGSGGKLERYYLKKVKVPYVCIETGKEAAPLKHKSFTSIYKKNKTIIEKTAGLYV